MSSVDDEDRETQPGAAFSTGGGDVNVWVDGRIVGGWAQRKTGEVVFQLLDDIGAERHRMVEEGAAQLQALLGDLRLTPRFPAAVDRALAG